MKQKTLFIFDVDGTLVNAYRAIQKSLNYTLKKFGHISVSYEATKMNVGRGDRKFIESFFPKSEAEKALKVFKQHHKKAVADHSKTLPYAKFVLYQLRQRGKKIAVATNRPSLFTHRILRSLHLTKYFDLIVCADEVKSHKPKPKILNTIVRKMKTKKEEAIYIGDMDIDLETARRAKIDALFITGGSAKLNQVKKFRNKKVIRSLKGVLKYA